MSTSAKPRVAIIGAGRLGSNLCAWLSAANYQVSGLASRNVDRMREIMWASQSSAALFKSPREAALQGDLVFITVPDAHISEVVKEIIPHADDHSKRTFVHCAGSKLARELADLKELGAAIGVFHPIQSFAPLPKEGRPEASPFTGISIGIEAQSEDKFEMLAQVASDLSAKPLRLGNDARSRARYHASAVLASNALVALMDSAVGLLVHDGHAEPEARAALLTLVQGTVNNLAKMPAPEALTGPVARGDAETLAAHLAALPPAAKALYRATMRAALATTKSAGRIDANIAERLLGALGNE
ncbi:MAG: DUF2520 domain-containing protein [Planctomycetes bacterium]|nr:DUF2520 domain-containing protein [Planctomycetota bacterium]